MIGGETRPDPREETIILLGHGSRDVAAIEEFERFINLFKAHSGFPRVKAGYLELTAPSISEAIDAAVAEGAKRIWTYPLFLFPGRHMLNDLPRLLTEARGRHREVPIHFGEAMHRHPKLLELARLRIGPLASEGGRSALLLVANGGSEPGRIEAVERFAAKLRPAFPGVQLLSCFAEIAWPSLSDAFDQCAAMGKRSIVVFPCFLFTGRILQGVYLKMEKLKERHPGLSVRVAEYFGAHPLLAEIVWEGIHQAREVAGGPGLKAKKLTEEG
ncbi:MAG: sirohydrochlorin chelatase [Nitrospirae bacterium]|nr:sirohydrochlorin chelatase [Candidatus Manganitrophaceae bacterium]